MEEWKDIDGYNGIYQISNMGRVKSLERFRKGKHNSLVFVNEKILKSGNDKNGYLQVCLYKDGKNKHFKVHRLVAQAFLDNPKNLPEVNHKDEDKTNNSVTNIEYCDRSYNCNFGSRNERVAKAQSTPVLQFTKDGKFVKKWDGLRHVEKELGFNHSNISLCCKGKLKSVGGYIWRYEKEKGVA